MTDPLLEIIPGSDGKRNLNRLNDIEKNISNIRQEFYGQPEVCHVLAGNIVRLRREPDNAQHQETFWHLLNTYTDTLLQHLDVRWMLSVCDTIVDIGDATQSAIAMNIVQCVNQTNIHHTLLVNAIDGRLNVNKLQTELKYQTWGGMITADVPSGDMIYNMMTRLDKVVAQDELLNRIWQTIKDIGREDKAIVLNHICEHSRHAHQRKYFL